MMKSLYCIRHGYALHNHMFDYIGPRAYTDFRDTPLLEEGIQQAKRLGKEWACLKDVELVLVSPCQRTLQTATYIFKDSSGIPIVAKDFLIEFPMGGVDICNKRRSKKDLAFLYPHIDFSQLSDEVEWSDKDETVDDLQYRIKQMLNYVSRRREETIAIVSHSSYMGLFKDNLIGDEDHELKHCYPYHILLKYDKNKKLISFDELL